MSYIDGFVAAVPQENKQAYLDHAREALSLFKDHGARGYRQPYVNCHLGHEV